MCSSINHCFIFHYSVGMASREMLPELIPQLSSVCLETGSYWPWEPFRYFHLVLLSIPDSLAHCHILYILFLQFFFVAPKALHSLSSLLFKWKTLRFFLVSLRIFFSHFSTLLCNFHSLWKEVLLVEFPEAMATI